MSKLTNVNTADVIDAIRLGCRTMSSVFNADDNGIPFFQSRVWPVAYLAHCPVASLSHVPGRHLNGLLNAEDAAGITIAPEAVVGHEKAAFFSFSGSFCQPLDRKAINGPLNFYEIHNLREGMHALCALVRHRDSQRARQIAERAIDTVFTYWTPADRWDADRVVAEHGVAVSSRLFILSEARAIGPLVKYFRATGHGPALELATVLKDKVIGEYFLEDGDYRHETFGRHTHSVTCVMSSLAQFAELTRDAPLMERVRSFYDRGLWKMRDDLGWVIENATATDDNADKGEGNNTGDIVETALILGRWGYPQYFEDAERIVRGHLLPSQLRDISFIQEPPNPDNEDGKRRVADRHLGAWGFPAPYGHHPVGVAEFGFNMDIVGGVVASLCEVVRHQVHTDVAGNWVNLLFDHDGETIKVESPYTHEQLRVTVATSAPLHVRMPSWVDRKHVRIVGATEGRGVPGPFLFFPHPTPGQPITIHFELSVQEMVLHHRLRDIRVRLRGDEVVAMDNFGQDMTYFDPYE